jgi:transcriptional regulator with XRE-family HTH domain/quercetin dioxygenase-like cupin family protein
MPTSEMGERIRAERERQGISLRALARDVGVSASMISQIENGKSRPSVSTLYAITTALGLPMQDVFATESQAAGGGSGDSAPPTSLLGALGAARGIRLGPHVPPKDRQVLTLDSGVTWERLGSLPQLDVDFLQVTYAPGGSSSSTAELMRHPGWAYGYIVSGSLVLTLGFDEIVLDPGDAVSFDSTTPHRYRNESDQPAVGIWFVMQQ